MKMTCFVFSQPFHSKEIELMEQYNQTDPKLESKKKKRNSKIAATLIAVAASVIATAFITFLITWTVAQTIFDKEDGHLVYSVKQVHEILRDHYFYYEEDEKALTDAALKGIAQATGDRYAEYYTEDEYENLTKQNSRSYVGIGILTQVNEEGNIEIVEVYDDTPASEAGLMRGDVIVELNGVRFSGETLSEFLGNLHAEDGAANDFVILRGDREIPFTIIAREVHTPSVSYRMLTDTIGYIHLVTFHGTCVDETKEAIAELRKQGMKQLVFDLRDNLGGSLYDALDIADMFLPKDYIITTLRSRTGEVTEYKTEDQGIDMRMVLLVNEMSASASELVAGAWKDYDAAYLIGTKTYGKGIVQSFFKVSETDGWLKITTEAYYTPNGVCVQDDGIEPDMTVTLSEEAMQYSIDSIPFELDAQLQAAIKYLED